MVFAIDVKWLMFINTFSIKSNLGSELWLFINKY